MPPHTPSNDGSLDRRIASVVLADRTATFSTDGPATVVPETGVGDVGKSVFHGGSPAAGETRVATGQTRMATGEADEAVLDRLVGWGAR